MGTEAAKGRWSHVVARESIAKERSGIIRIRGQSGPCDLEERLRGGIRAGHGRDGLSTTAGSTAGTPHPLVADITHLETEEVVLGGDAEWLPLDHKYILLGIPNDVDVPTAKLLFGNHGLVVAMSDVAHGAWTHGTDVE
ncbi:hypothetical protein NDU88_003493 [Pleurodeles waltl]|uniref:Uncharacterized protein n=1 Tax=Pleurodeles waltl TaxID=8319 RepID=A0AAV7PBD6_PLEWA|nr:hypothetical protein NDU88_003493 [Pleurodeles waltl]